MKSFILFAAAAAAALGADQNLGKPLTLGEPVALAALMANPGASVDKTVQVKGKVTEVCEMMGCWMNLTDDAGNLLRIKVEHGTLVFPKDSIGKMAIAEGKLEKEVMTRDQVVAAAKHEAEEQGRTFDESKIKGGKTVYRIAGSGAVILDNK